MFERTSEVAGRNSCDEIVAANFNQDQPIVEFYLSRHIQAILSVSARPREVYNSQAGRFLHYGGPSWDAGIDT